MIRTVITILFSMYLGHSFAQGTFFYQHDTKNYSNEPRAIVELDDSYIIAGFNDGGWAATDLFLMKIDKDGNFLWDKVIDKEQIEEYNAIIDVGDGILAGGRRWINQDSRNLLTKFDYDGNVIWDKLIGDTATLAFDNVIRDLLKIEDGVLVATSGFGTSTNTTDAMLMKIDFEGNILWETLYNSDYNEQRIDYLEKITKTDDDYLLKMHSENQGLKLFPHIIKVDEQGNEIWRKEFHYYQSTTEPNADTNALFNDFVLNNQNNVLAILIKIDSVSFLSTISIVELDIETGQEINYHEIESKYHIDRDWLDVYKNEYNELIVFGRGAKPGTNYGLQLYAGKFDKNYNIITERHYGDTMVNEIYHTAIPTSDEGFLIAGRTLNSNQPLGEPSRFNTILYKTDCMGNLFWSDEGCFIPGKDHLEFNLYPNPFSDYITIDVPYGMKEKVEFLLYNVSGQKIMDRVYSDHRSINIYTDGLASGMYIYKIRFKDVFVKTGKIIKQ